MTHQETVKTIAQRFVDRAEALELKGKKRDEAALGYFVGAATCADVAGDAKLAQYLGAVAAMIISVRGYFGVKEIAAEALEKVSA